MTDSTCNELVWFADEWTSAGLPKKSVAPVLAALERTAVISAEAQVAARERRTAWRTQDLGFQHDFAKSRTGSGPAQWESDDPWLGSLGDPGEILSSGR